MKNLNNEKNKLSSSHSNESCGQFHQHFMRKFLHGSPFGSFFYLHVNRENLPKRSLCEKFLSKMLMKLTPELARRAFEGSMASEICGHYITIFIATVSKKLDHF